MQGVYLSSQRPQPSEGALRLVMGGVMVCWCSPPSQHTLGTWKAILFTCKANLSLKPALGQLWDPQETTAYLAVI